MRHYQEKCKGLCLTMNPHKQTLDVTSLVVGIRPSLQLIIWNNTTGSFIARLNLLWRISASDATISFKQQVKRQSTNSSTGISEDCISVYHLAPPVQALFVIGDSSAGCGTKNFLGTFARADRLPYGRDFDTHQPTGRFCNGRIPVDYLALRLGLPFLPSYLGQAGSIEEMILGVSYASAGADSIFSSGSELGQHISLAQQIEQFTDTVQQFVVTIGEDATTDLISSSLFYILIGSNDYIHYYLLNASKVRKVVVMGLAPIGCAHYYLRLYSSKNGECVENINDMILEFNFSVRYMVSELNEELVDATVIFCDAFEGSMDIIQNHNRYGFNVTDEASCGLGKYKGWIMCVSPEMACNNASSNIWWDQFHLTNAVNAILADVWSSLHTPMCYPMYLQDMLAQNTR